MLQFLQDKAENLMSCPQAIEKDTVIGIRLWAVKRRLDSLKLCDLGLASDRTIKLDV